MKKLFFAVFSAFAALALLISIGAYRTQAKELTSQVKISQVKPEAKRFHITGKLTMAWKSVIHSQFLCQRTLSLLLLLLAQ